MKNINKLIKTMFSLSLITLLFISCDDDEYVAPGSFTDLSFTWTTGASSDRVSEVNRFYSISDLSAGAEFVEWTIPSSAFFLKGPVPNNLDNHDAYIQNPGETTSNDKTISVLWKEGDSLSEIRYYGIFNDSTSFIFNLYYDNTPGIQRDVPDTIKTVNIDGKWIADYTFLIDVYDTVVAVPEVRYMDGTILDHQNTDAVTVTFGDKLIFEDMSGLRPDNENIGRPETAKWRMHTLESDTTQQTNVFNQTTTRVELTDRIVDTITFDDLGEYQVELKASRARTERLKASDNIYDIPTVFTVVPLNEPLTYLGDVVESDADLIQIDLSHRIRPLTENVAGNFTVEVDGIAKTIESVSRNSNGTRLFIALVDPIVPSDASKIVTISYDGANADLRSFDERPLEAFDNLPIDVYVPQPVVQQGDIVELEDQTIQIPFDSAFDPTSLTDPTVGFEILVNGTSFDIASISINVSDAKVLDVKLVEQIYRPDVITASYDGSGTIANVGTGIINAFIAKTVVMHDVNLFGEGGMEDAEGSSWVADAANAGGTVEYSTEQAANGTYSLKMATVGAERARANNLLSPADLKAGVTYSITYKQYIVSGNTMTADKVYTMVPKTQLKPVTFYNDNPKDAWFDVTYDYTPGSDVSQYMFIQINPGEGTIYFDDFKVQTKEVRP
ncbi:hypothetical protein [Lutibacter citreus]|uniref:hypothetical protein n=1 Tax=Lutibacter citreus TaxID=2138210 RepID=UPI000DBEA6EB|nr:hypothetical protein [Lutibacter citreus]